MRILIAMDSFKEACSARAACDAVARGWLLGRSGDNVLCVPMADGGEGTVDAVSAAWGLAPIVATVSGPLGAPVDAAFAYDAGRAIAVIEMASASGLSLLSPELRNPTITTTRGTGELIARALELGAREIVVGLGGSATNDGGAGAARALGICMLDVEGGDLPEGGAALAALARLELSGLNPLLRSTRLRVACDVDNPLCGPSGASAVYGPQKGATPEMVVRLDAALAHYARVIQQATGVDLADLPGSGAAGGLAAGLVAFADAILEPGVTLVAEAVGLADKMTGADLVITGEGRLDAQSLRGKTPVGVARLARAQRIPVVALAGTLGTGWEAVLAEGIVAARAITPVGTDLLTALRETERHLELTAEQVARIWE